MATPVQDRQQVDSNISYDFNYVETPPDRLVCKTCQLPCREAQKSICCGHVFCKRDIYKMKAATAVSHVCPICRVEPFKTYPDRAVDREIKGLKIYCRNKEVGCGCSWSGELDQIDAHLNKCEIACKYCKEVMHYTAMISHINECPCYCQYCASVVEKDGQHMEKCSKFLIPCPNTCGKDKIPRDEIDSHKNECRLEMVCCEYYDVGCKTTLVREEMPAHYRDAMEEHLQYMHSVVRQLSKVVTEFNLLENAEQIKELLSNQTLHEEAKTKIVDPKYNKIDSSMSRSRVILVGVLIFVFSILVGHYEDKFTLTVEQLHSLSTTDNVHQLQNDQITKAVIEASANIEVLKHFSISILYHYISQLTPLTTANMDFLSELSATFPQVRPVFKLTDYKEKIKRKEDWTSSPFLAFDGGYQLCLKVYPAGIGEGTGDHVSVELYLMKGPYEDKLRRSGHWPLKGKFSVKLVLLVRKHYGESLLEYTKTVDVKETHRVTYNGMVKIGGVNQFVPHSKVTRRTISIVLPSDMYFRVQYNEDHISYRNVYTLSEQLNTHTHYLYNVP